MLCLWKNYHSVPFKSCKGSCLWLCLTFSPCSEDTAPNISGLQEFSSSWLTHIRQLMWTQAPGTAQERPDIMPPSWGQPLGQLESTDLGNAGGEESGHPTKWSKQLIKCLGTRIVLPDFYKIFFNGKSCFAPYVLNIRFSMSCDPPHPPHWPSP